MNEQAARLVKRLRDEGERTLRYFRALQPGDWQKTVYTDGTTWTVLDVLKHFVSAESGMALLITNILAGSEGVPEDFDLDRYNQRRVGKMGEQTPEQLLEAFARNRRKTIDLVSRMSDQDLVKTGRHPFLGVTQVKDIVKMMYRHNQIHQREMHSLWK